MGKQLAVSMAFLEVVNLDLKKEGEKVVLLERMRVRLTALLLVMLMGMWMAAL